MSSNNNAGNRMLSKGYGSVSAGAVCTLKTEQYDSKRICSIENSHAAEYE